MARIAPRSKVALPRALAAGSIVLTAITIAAAFCCKAQAQQGWEPVVARSEEEKAVPAARAPKAPVPVPASRPTPTPATAAAPVSASAPAAERLPLQTMAAATIGSRKGGEAPPPLQTVAAKQYCANIAEPAAEARFAWQRKVLADMEAQVEKRIAVLETKIADYQTWVTRRDEFVKKAQDNLVVIYSKMRAEASAAQLAVMDEETAAAVVAKLDPRIASIILNEMETKRAARLTAIISGAARVAPAKPPKAPAEEKKS